MASSDSKYLCTELVECSHEVTSLSRSPDQGALPDAVSRRRPVTSPTTTPSNPPSRGRDAVVNLVALSPLFQPSGGNEMQ